MNERSVFIAALERDDSADRAAYLDQACADNAALRQRVERLLQLHERESLFLAEPAPQEVATVEEPISQRPGAVIGPYKLMEQIGEGGMGLVFVAEQQQPVRRKVALKLIKPGMDTRQVIARFEAERQALALMDHPNIAKVLDAGTIPLPNDDVRFSIEGKPEPQPPSEIEHRKSKIENAGRPYFIMELVKGVPITEYCDHSQVPIRERLELFLDVCYAVQHAHQKGIIHRDLKPSNVLVTTHDGKPVVKVIDFGVAKAIGQQLTDKTVYTQFAQMIGTPLYMSPEQAGLSGLDVDTRSDIYSLGVLLYELLTGTTPFDKERLSEVGYEEMRRIIREEDPPKPSTRLSNTRSAERGAQNGKGPARFALRAPRWRELDWIVMKALEKDRNRRYETASAFAADVQRYLHDEPVLACPPSAWYRFRKFARRHKQSLATAALVGVMVLGAGAGCLWVWQDRTDRAATAARREVEIEEDATQALHEATRFQEQGKYTEALAALRKAEGLLAAGGGENLRERVGEVGEDLAMLARVDDIRLEQAEVRPDTSYDFARVVPLYAQAFRAYGIDVTALEPAEATERIRRRAIRAALVAVLYDWAALVPNKAERERLLTVAQAADTEGVFRAWIEALSGKDGAALKQLAASVKPESLASSTLRIMGYILFARGYEVEALELLRRARRHYPGDFWLNYDLGFVLWRGGRGDRIPVGSLASVAIERPEVIQAFTTNAADIPVGSPASVVKEPRLDEAVYYLTAAAALRPHNPKVLLNLGVVFALQGKWVEAADAFREAIKVRENFPLAHAQLGQAFYIQRKHDEALAEINLAIRHQPDLALPDLALVHNSLGLVLAAKGQRDAAIAAYEEAIKHQPKFGAAYHNLGNVYLVKGLREKAAAEFEKAIQLIPNEPALYQNLGYLYMNMGLPEKAVAVFEKATRFLPKHPEGYLHLGVALAVLRRAGQVPAGERAIAALREAVRLKPEEYYWHFFLGLMLGLENRHKEAAEAYLQAVRHKLDFARGHYFLGATYCELGKVGLATAALREAVRYQPDFPEAHYKLGAAYLSQGNLDAAAAAFKEAIRRRPKLAEAHYDLGRLFNRQGKFAEAAAAYRQAIAVESDYAAAHHNLGTALYQLGKFDEAAAAYRACLKYRPKQGDGHYGLGLSLSSQGKYAEALAALEAGHKVIPRDDPLRARIEEGIQKCSRLVELDRKLPGVLKGQVDAGAEERIELAGICTTKELFGAAARLFEEAFAAQPGLAADLDKGYRFAASRVAALAAAGRGKDEPPLNDQARVRWRQQAMAWLRADLAAWTKRLEKSTPADRTAVRQQLERWLKDADLAGIREAVAVANLPQAERETCRKLWTDVAEPSAGVMLGR
jgi:tetratricopeptide (TPR) repeat protein